MASSMATGSGMGRLASSAVRVTCRSSSSSSRSSTKLATGRRPLGVGVGGGAPHGGGHLAHALHQAPAPGRHLAAEPPGGPAGDVLGQVAVALEVGQHAQDGHQLAQLLGPGGLAVTSWLLGQVVDLGDEQCRPSRRARPAPWPPRGRRPAGRGWPRRWPRPPGRRPGQRSRSISSRTTESGSVAGAPTMRSTPSVR